MLRPVVAFTTCAMVAEDPRSEFARRARCGPQRGGWSRGLRRGRRGISTGLPLELQLPSAGNHSEHEGFGQAPNRAVVQEHDLGVEQELPGEIGMSRRQPFQGGSSAHRAIRRRAARPGEDGDGERGRGEGRHVTVEIHEVHADIDHLAPARRRRCTPMRRGRRAKASSIIASGTGEHEADDHRRY